ncbi:DUF397 domain-containing protein [Streptomyces sp. SPB162]|uniref:DUF397 domain-containing protein n=1 Tax=Streptomyces sp. SPB162 TaxID=2940560 RepID=UPI002406BF9C|nr:DUF397 domain-containing protein [Streptomyces sp. SPB162]MDF9813734.1 hypothetical protein [Streptomyces sp. SPB162]
MTARHVITTEWKKSSYSGNNGNCVEVCAPTADRVAVRDSKDPYGPALAFDPEVWSAFVDHVTRGTFDRI